MSITQDHSNMLYRTVRPKLLTHEYKRRNYIWGKVPMKIDWNEGEYQFAFEQGENSTFAINELPAAGVVGQAGDLLGTISSATKVRGALQFRDEDLKVIEGKMDNYKRSLLKQQSRFVKRTTEIGAHMIMNGQQLAPFLTDGQAGGTFTIAPTFMYLFKVGMYFELFDDDTGAAQYYITAINKNAATITITVSATRGGGTANISAYTVAQNAGCYFKGGSAATQLSILDVLLTSGNGGSASIYGQTKAGKPHLEAFNATGAAFTAPKWHEQILDTATDAWLRDCTFDTLLMSPFKANALIKLIDTKTDYPVIRKSDDAIALFAGEVAIDTGLGLLRIKGLREMPDSKCVGIDWKSLRVMSNGLIKFDRDPKTGSEFFRVRETTGLYSLVDQYLNFALELHTPAANMVIHSLPAGLK